ncbi:MAG: response regulator transcription factor, partial [Myxococcota bacterium]|nr:response regulator transcription factor [Myxococcota bacterium]
LEHEGYDVTLMTQGETALEKLGSDQFDLLLLDQNLPGLGGQTLLHTARSRGVTTPAIMVTAITETRIKLEAFKRGADDYLTKPFDMAELSARVDALIRRSQAARELPSSKRLRMGKVWVNLEARWVENEDGDRTELSPTDASLLELFAREPGTTLSRADIIEEVWGMDAFPSERTVDNFIVRLRRLIEPDPATPICLLSVRGKGYRYHPVASP